MPHLIGLDIGTTGCKACVFTPEGNVVGYGFREYEVICDSPAMAEQDPMRVWSLTLEVLRDAVGSSGVHDVAAMSVSVQGDAIIALGADSRPVYNAILGMDYRAEPQARYCREHLGDRRLFDRTGMRPHPMNSVVKMMWLRDERPQAFARARRIVTYADFISLQLCGEVRIDFTMASRTMGFDLVRREWATDILADLGIDPSLLSPAVPSGEAIGTLRTDIAASIGLSTCPVVVSGGHDQTCAALGAGVVRAGSALISTGTAEVMSAAIDAPAITDEMFESYYPCYYHTVPGMYFTFSLNHAGGILFRWYRDTLGLPEASGVQAGGDPYDAIVNAMPEGPSPVMVLPHWTGSGTPYCDVGSRGAILGLSMATTRHQIALAVLESLCFELKLNCEHLSRAGIAVEQLTAVGGGARSARWLQLKADILGKPVTTLAVREAACLGAAILAGAACGVYSSAADGAAQTVRKALLIEPDPRMVAAYNDRFAVYRQLYPTLKNLNRSFGN